ncbi:hypothetical protein COO60DRAFT_1501890 [Scenedesmus sp. NREL 46B-D3]|nr:hypothetical protein COO60DRAFT_1501890 [Scenedesmus sp. NREL 46B-D3]
MVCVIWGRLAMLSAVVLLSCPASSLEPIGLVDSKSVCGFSKITQITCWSQKSSEVLPFIARMEYTTEDGASAAWCPMPIKENREKQVLTLDPGDSIFSVRVCYDPSPDQSRIIGIMFGGIARQYTCGNVWIAPERCVSSQSAVQAPLSYFDGQCSAIYVAMNNVCWNKWHRPRVLPQACLAGEGVRPGAAYCQPCRSGTYNPGGLGTCLQCPEREVTPGSCCGDSPLVQTSGAARCSCRPGYGLHPAQHRCTPCPAGFYSPGGARSPCTSCPLPFMTTPRRAARLEECVCMPGYGYNKTSGRCDICRKGFYGTGLTNSTGTVAAAGQPTQVPCQACPANTTTARPQSGSMQACVTR